MATPLDLSVPEIASAVRSRAVSAAGVVDACLRRIAQLDGTFNAVVATDERGALDAASQIDATIASGGEVGPFCGVPMLVKDLNNAVGLPTTFGARSMQGFHPPFDDHTVAGMRSAGFVIVGKTNTPEIGSLPVTEPLLHGPTRSPWSTDHTAGGSSGGAAAAVAAGYVPAAHGSDGGGSIRIPASCCGVVGLKPSRGRVSQAPLFGDQVMGYSTQGPLGRRVIDVACALDAMQGYAIGDPYHLESPSTPFRSQLRTPAEGLDIGLVTTTPWASPSSEVQRALEGAATALEALGHRVRPLQVRLSRSVIDQFTTIWSASAAATPLPRADLEPHNQAFADRGDRISAPALLQAFTSLQVEARAFVDACGAHDAVLAPILMEPPPLVGALDGLTHDALLARLTSLLGLTPVINVTGQPAIALPVHVTDEGLPIGVQVIGPHAGEGLLLRIAAGLEEAAPWPSPPIRSTS